MSRHSVDPTQRFSRDSTQPAEREVEVTGCDPLPEGFATEIVRREPYIASDDLENAVNMAMALGRPLLLQGDPGAGKTRLAHHVAYTLGLPLEEAHVKSTSRGQDLLYTYDAVSRLYDAQLQRGSEESGGRKFDNARDYIRLGPLGRVIVRACYGRRSVLLIDEIDKADLDFPNDLLREIDQLAFEVAEAPSMRYAVSAPDVRPIIVVTNNEEKALPGAFLRRCIFHYVEFPSSARDLEAVLGLHGVDNAPLRREAAHMLLRLRQELDLLKQPGLSELLDWAIYMQSRDVDPASVEQLPHRGALLKQHSDQLRVTEWLAQP
ncbi:AAA family ATPase [Catellatospora chokoriensis]|uniref:ATPase AAA n=1 Tax=Catellatospora chokoriensis TaxID=310353 RepID=A0A8J3JSG9_9ACTN|nr:MoxR family ATPase [Catellatospora chokoriensis]GIF90261.1 ATPase AAA [Catellatospora chokoriensis]